MPRKIKTMPDGFQFNMLTKAEAKATYESNKEVFWLDDNGHESAIDAEFDWDAKWIPRNPNDRSVFCTERGFAK